MPASYFRAAKIVILFFIVRAIKKVNILKEKV